MVREWKSGEQQEFDPLDGLAPEGEMKIFGPRLSHELKRADAVFEERGAALEKWALYLDNLLAPGESKVAFLPAKQAGT